MEAIQALGYLRVSTDEQVDSGAGLEAQKRAVEAEATRRGWDLTVVIEGLSAKDLRRPALLEALDSLDKGKHQILVVSKLDRLSRSVSDFGGLLDRAAKRGWSVVCLDLGVDTTTPVGEFTANVVVSASQYERRIIGQRTKDALASKKAAGVRLGRPSTLPADVVSRIVRERAGGMSLPAIAAGLERDGIATARHMERGEPGGRWYPSTVSKVLQGQDAKRTSV